jgi:hypothetical protein
MFDTVHPVDKPARAKALGGPQTGGCSPWGTIVTMSVTYNVHWVAPGGRRIGQGVRAKSLVFSNFGKR